MVETEREVINMLSDKAIGYAEDNGIYEIHKEKGNVITYYSFYGDDINYPFIKVTHNLKTGKEIRKRLRYKKAPKFLKGKYGTRYNYHCG